MAGVDVPETTGTLTVIRRRLQANPRGALVAASVGGVLLAGAAGSIAWTLGNRDLLTAWGQQMAATASQWLWLALRGTVSNLIEQPWYSPSRAWRGRCTGWRWSAPAALTLYLAVVSGTPPPADAPGGSRSPGPVTASRRALAALLLLALLRPAPAVADDVGHGWSDRIATPVELLRLWWSSEQSIEARSPRRHHLVRRMPAPLLPRSERVLHRRISKRPRPVIDGSVAGRYPAGGALETAWRQLASNRRG